MSPAAPKPAWRLAFPIIYLDNNATTRPTPGVAEAVDLALRELWHNPSSVHRPGQAARAALELARQDLADLIGVKPRELILTGSGTESIDLAIRGSLAARPRAHGSPLPAIVSTRIEHAAVRDLLDDLSKTGQAEVRWAPVGHHGVVDPRAIEPLLDPRVALVSVQWANNETGAIQPVEEVGRVCRAAGIQFHCDGTQWVGKEPVHLGDSPPMDLLTFSPHKFHGPKGVGSLWVRRSARLRPVLHGAQEMGRRGGTENVPGILGAGAAAREASAWLADPSERTRLSTLRDRLERGLIEALNSGGGALAAVNGPTEPAARLWNTTNIGFHRLEAEALLMLLSEQGLCASAGAACSSGSLDPSPVLLAMGIDPEFAHGSLRFSLSRQTTEAEVEAAIGIIVGAVRRLSASSASLPD
jgi:cysteine desulfurase